MGDFDDVIHPCTHTAVYTHLPTHSSTLPPINTRHYGSTRQSIYPSIRSMWPSIHPPAHIPMIFAYNIVFASKPNSGPNSYSVFGRIAAVGPNTNSIHVTYACQDGSSTASVQPSEFFSAADEQVYQTID